MTPKLLFHISHPLVKFTPIEPGQVPQRWQQQTYLYGLHLFCIIPFGSQYIRISCENEGDEFVLRDNGSSALIKRWDHRILIRGQGENTLYTDEIDVSAGILTPLVWLFARTLYGHRQRRWRELARANFNFDAGEEA